MSVVDNFTSLSLNEIYLLWLNICLFLIVAIYAELDKTKSKPSYAKAERSE